MKIGGGSDAAPSCAYASAMSVNMEKVLRELAAQKVISGRNTRYRRLAGGVSSDIYLIEEPGRKVVLKQALEYLRVDEPWRVDVGRNRVEQRFMRLVTTFLPGTVPCLLYGEESGDYFVMEYLEGYRNWKSLLLAGNASIDLADAAGCILGSLHKHTWMNASVGRRFATMGNFHALRIDPYLLTTARRHPEIAGLFQAEALRLERSQICLIHGDFSPKNIMIKQGRMILLDCEVACFGDPAFDLAFLFNHFLLKAMLHRGGHQPFLRLVAAAWSGYQRCFDTVQPGLEIHTARLLPLLMLARVDGKSPVEYIDNDMQRNIIRNFVYELLPQNVSTVEEICTLWEQRLDDKHAD